MLVEGDVVYVFDAFLRKSFFIFVNRFFLLRMAMLCRRCDVSDFGVSVINVLSKSMFSFKPN